MGLRYNVAIVVAVFITFQILSNHCMPHHTSHCKCPLRTTARNIKSLDSKRMKKQVSTNISKSIRFPKVEYPSSTGPEEYYRFLNEYPIQFESKNNVCNCSCQTKYKRKMVMAAHPMSKPKVITSAKKYDPEPQPYCFRRSGFFPEVEYPLSARDMWLPKYWSRLQDVKMNDKPGNALEPSYDIDSENAALNALIKALNTRKVQSPPKNEANIERILNETANTLEINGLNRNRPLNNSKENGPTGKIEDKPKTINSQSQTELFTNKEANDNIQNDEGSNTNSTIIRSSTLSNNSLQTPSTVNPDIEITSLNNSETHINPHNSSMSINNISAESLDITTTSTTTSLSTNIFTPFDYYDCNLSNNLSITDMTTPSPFAYVTSPMSASDIIFTNDDDLSYQMSLATTNAPSTTTSLPILTSIQPSCLSFSPSVSNDYYDADVCHNNLSEIDLNILAKDWIRSSNDSYLTCQIPDDTDDWIIYVDKQNSSDKTLGESKCVNVVSSPFVTEEKDRSEGLSKNVQDAPKLPLTNVTTAMTTTPEPSIRVHNTTTEAVVENTKAANTTKDDTPYEYIDDSLTLCTEIPYDFVLNSENGYTLTNDSLLTDAV